MQNPYKIYSVYISPERCELKTILYISHMYTTNTTEPGESKY